jgi:hypothetical protein
MVLTSNGGGSLCKQSSRRIKQDNMGHIAFEGVITN